MPINGELLICDGCGQSIQPGESVQTLRDESILCVDCKDKEIYDELV